MKGLPHRGSAGKMAGSGWLFPAAAAVLLIILTVFKISGSSVGLYNLAFYGPHYRDSHLLANHPRSIRSDELLYTTPTTVGQAKNNFPRISHMLGSEDMSVVSDAPYFEWTELFKPQNFAFFVLPLEYAFAFKWWLLAFLLVVSCYLFCLELLPGKRFWASLISLSVLFSPFVQWWYQTVTLAPLFYSLFIMLVVIKLTKAGISRRNKLFLSAMLAYLLVAFALILYPPFQIPCALVVGAYLVGYTLEQWHILNRRDLIDRLKYVLVAGFTAAIVLILFIKTRSPAIHAIENTAYPGKRVVKSGGYGVRAFFSTPYLSHLQSDTRAANYYANQSESSNFILLSPFLIVSSLVVALRRWKAQKTHDWTLITVSGILMLFTVRLFVPHTSKLFTYLGLGSTPLVRIMIGFGLAGIIQLLLLLRCKRQPSGPTIWLSATLATGVTLFAGTSTHRTYPLFLSSKLEIIFISLLIGLIVYLLQNKKVYATFGLVLLTSFSFVSTANVNPLYVGLSPLINSRLARTVADTGQPNAKWAAADSRLLVTTPFAQNKSSLTGVYAYPQPNVWSSLQASSLTYNRYAHVLTQIDPSSTDSSTKLSLMAEDYFTVSTSACSKFLRDQRVTYLLLPGKISTPHCATLDKTIYYPNGSYYIYRLVP